jgi:hypothetical protein
MGWFGRGLAMGYGCLGLAMAWSVMGRADLELRWPWAGLDMGLL